MTNIRAQGRAPTKPNNTHKPSKPSRPCPRGRLPLRPNGEAGVDFIGGYWHDKHSRAGARSHEDSQHPYSHGYPVKPGMTERVGQQMDLYQPQQAMSPWEAAPAAEW